MKKKYFIGILFILNSSLFSNQCKKSLNLISNQIYLKLKNDSSKINLRKIIFNSIIEPQEQLRDEVFEKYKIKVSEKKYCNQKLSLQEMERMLLRLFLTMNNLIKGN